MKLYTSRYKNITIAILAVVLVATAPIMALAKDNGKDGRDGKNNGNGKGKSERVEKIEKVEKRDEKRDKKEDKDNKKKVTWVGCVTKSFGHLIAPGWIKKNGQIQLSEDCSRDDLPNGIAWLYGYHSTSTPTTTPDVTAPVISDLSVKSIGTTKARIVWDTNEKADSTVWYSTVSPVNTATASIIQKNNLTKDHSVELNNLSVNTTYYVLVRSKDPSGNISTSSQISFKTLATTTVDTTGPVIINAVATSTSHNSARITWDTDELADTRVLFGTTSPVTTANSNTATVSGFDTNHTINLNGLNASTTYYALIVSKDITGNTSTSSQLIFTTPATTTVVVAPVISNIIATVGTSTVKIAWDTDKSADSTVFYGTTSPLDTTSSTTASTTNATLVMDHELTVTGLATSTTYYFVVQSVSTDSGTKKSNQFTLTTSN